MSWFKLCGARPLHGWVRGSYQPLQACGNFQGKGFSFHC